MTEWTDEQKVQRENEVIRLTNDQQRMEELTIIAKESMSGAHPIFTIVDQFRLMAYNESITGAEHQALLSFNDLPGILF